MSKFSNLEKRGRVKEDEDGAFDVVIFNFIVSWSGFRQPQLSDPRKRRSFRFETPGPNPSPSNTTPPATTRIEFTKASPLKPPKFHTIDFTVPTLAQQSVLDNALITFNVTARNSNQHMGIYYDSMVVSVLYKDQRFGSTALFPPFSQEPKTTTIVHGTIGAATLTVNTDEWKEFMNDRKLGLCGFGWVDVTNFEEQEMSSTIQTKFHSNICGKPPCFHSLCNTVRNQKLLLMASPSQWPIRPSCICLWLALRPRSPTYTIVNFSVPAVNDSNASDHGTIRTIPSFYQGKDKTHRVVDQVDVKTRLWTGLRKAMMNATAELRADLSTKIKYKTWGIKSKHHRVNREGKIRIGKDGKISNKKKKVKLGHPSKKRKLRSSRYLSSINDT
ncbi:hypothetical protein F3Y22_tig00004111pilonHSYRG00058 [Hibiscus syriacus]|uniref:Late embryogenesis abundant protein LEA-2 subgroup domain-containing protein n=1 Tax=Hibiscus syriacus TaxID=106335 RepID=A0A6A3CN67_HIBSY|nr:hypothetical protein F3Y22_tig00004111pilonHSYRG00058 [Hibiscus syriacus]